MKSARLAWQSALPIPLCSGVPIVAQKKSLTVFIGLAYFTRHTFVLISPSHQLDY
jgi:hypothetical protein